MAKTVADLHASVQKLNASVAVIQRIARTVIPHLPPPDLSDHVTAVDQANAALEEAADLLTKAKVTQA